MDINELCKIIAEVLESESLEIKKEDRLKEDLNMCSFDMMMVILLIEDKFQKKVDIMKIKENPTIDGLLQAIS